MIEKTLTPTEQGEAVQPIHEIHGISIVRDCAAFKLARSAYDQPPGDGQIRDQEGMTALNQVVVAHPRWGVWKDVARLRA